MSLLPRLRPLITLYGVQHSFSECFYDPIISALLLGSSRQNGGTKISMLSPPIMGRAVRHRMSIHARQRYRLASTLPYMAQPPLEPGQASVIYVTYTAYCCLIPSQKAWREQRKGR